MYVNEEPRYFYTRLLDKIWDDHREIQEFMLKEFGKDFRKCKVEQLIKYRAIIIPNNSYLIQMLEEASAPQYGLYMSSKCIFNKRLVIPIIGFDGLVHSFVGYDNGNAITDLKERLSHIYYLYQRKEVFNKERYMLITPEEYKTAIELDYICLTDGVFDKITVSNLGIPCASLLSSRLTKYHIDYLRYIKNWIVLADNDDAGDMLTNYCKRFNPNTTRMRFDEFKDIDEFILAKESNENRFKDCIEEMKGMGMLIDWRIG